MKKNNNTNQVIIRLWPPTKTLLKKTTGHVSLETFKGNFEPDISKKKKNELGIYVSFWPGGCLKKNVCEEKTAHFHTYHQDLLIEETNPVPPKGITLFGLDIDKINDECINFIKSNPEWYLSGSSLITWLLSFFTKKMVSNCSGICGRLLEKGGIQNNLAEYYSEGSLVGSLGMVPMIALGGMYMLGLNSIGVVIARRADYSANIISLAGSIMAFTFVGTNFSVIKKSSLGNLIKNNFQNIKRGMIGSILGGIETFVVWRLLEGSWNDGVINPLLATSLGATYGGITAVGVSNHLAPGILIGAGSTTLGIILGSIIMFMATLRKDDSPFSMNSVSSRFAILIGLSTGLASAIISTRLVSTTIRNGILTPHGIQRYAEYVEKQQGIKSTNNDNLQTLKKDTHISKSNKELVKSGIIIAAVTIGFFSWNKKFVFDALSSVKRIFSMN